MATPFKKVVVVIDGARTHTTFSSSSMKPQVTMNLYKATNEKPHTLKSELKKLDLWPTGGLSLKEASEIFQSTVLYLTQRSEFEELCEDMDCIGLYLPNSHPILNPIERLWRGIKEKFRHKGIKSMASLKEEIENVLNHGTLDDHVNGWLKRSVRYRRYLTLNPDCKVPPMECQIRSKKFAYLDASDIVATSAIHDLLKDVDHPTFQNYVHWLNTARTLGTGLKLERSLLGTLKSEMPDDLAASNSIFFKMNRNSKSGNSYYVYGCALLSLYDLTFIFFVIIKGEKKGKLNSRKHVSVKKQANDLRKSKQANCSKKNGKGNQSKESTQKNGKGNQNKESAQNKESPQKNGKLIHNQKSQIRLFSIFS